MQVKTFSVFASIFKFTKTFLTSFLRFHRMSDLDEDSVEMSG